jgi:replication factor C subunit 3/5
MKLLDDQLKHEVAYWAAFYVRTNTVKILGGPVTFMQEHRIAMGNKDIYHLEAFIAKFMCLYKKYLLELFA